MRLAHGIPLLPETSTEIWPKIHPAGFDGFLISFSDQLDDAANRAALAFRNAIETAGWSGVKETATSLASTYLRFDPFCQEHAKLEADLRELAGSRDWYRTDLPVDRRLWRIPTVYSGEHAPQLEESAALVGLSVAEAIASISVTQVRVLTIGFAPGMPYLGTLEPDWNIPRLTAITSSVPEGALCLAIRQLVLFPVTTPTGWRQVGQTGVRLFQPDQEDPFLLRPGDEVLFVPAQTDDPEDLRALPQGGATWSVLA